ncbi:MAG: TniQ family protein, partial [Candidatus Thiodiazotropha sp. (ex Lucinoma borealis)]|nr:TniQ family protein [Candidatus Thiodiazotropha sp. (ex Lucinoma borealis)]
MLDMPIPYSDELLYSTIARAGIHQGIVSPKELLDEVFGNRKIVATLDLPSHLDVVASRYPKSLRISGEALAYKHTLFPLYAPFVTEDRRNTTLRSLCVGSRGAVHLVLGIAASRIRHTKNIRYCPSCIKRQLFEYGEYYWLRRWQVVGADSCLDHGALVYAKVPPHTIHRHQFFP